MEVVKTPQKNIALTDRDQGVLGFLIKNGWVTSIQLGEKFFSSKKACANRLRRLEQAQLIESMTLTKFKMKFWHERDLAKFMDVLPGHVLVYRMNLGLQQQANWSKGTISKYHMVAHQVLLTKVVSEVRKIIGDEITILTDPDLRQAKGNTNWPNPLVTTMSASNGGVIGCPAVDSMVPDICFTYHGQKIAIELERTPKKENFYYEQKRDDYAFKFDKVVFITTRDVLFKKLRNIFRGYPVFAVMSLIDLSVCFRDGEDPIGLMEFLNESNF